jgi:uncharacterized coiled-coil protein SlyX
MTIDTTKRYFTHDIVAAETSPVDDDGNLVDATEDFNWDAQTRVTVSNSPWVEQFETDQFYRLEAVVARPIEQTYHIDGKEYTFVKPRDALKEAQWRLDNLAWTLGHPNKRRVTDAEEVRGFWRGPRYDDTVDEQRVRLYIPANDEEALEYAQSNPAVSVGFANNYTLVNDYEGEIGGDVDTSDVDALQVDIYYDHVASVTRGRCSLEDGCGVVIDSETEAMQTETDDCDSDTTDSTTMTCDCDNDTNDDSPFGIESMTVDAIAEEHDDVAALVETTAEREQTIDSLEDDIDEREQQIDALKEDLKEANEALDSYREDKRREKVDHLTDLTDKWDEDTLMDSDEVSMDTLDERIEIYEDALGEAEVSETTIEDDADETVQNDDNTGVMEKGSSTIDLRQ